MEKMDCILPKPKRTGTDCENKVYAQFENKVEQKTRKWFKGLRIHVIEKMQNMKEKNWPQLVDSSMTLVIMNSTCISNVYFQERIDL